MEYIVPWNLISPLMIRWNRLYAWFRYIFRAAGVLKHFPEHHLRKYKLYRTTRAIWQDRYTHFITICDQNSWAVLIINDNYDMYTFLRPLQKIQMIFRTKSVNESLKRLIKQYQVDFIPPRFRINLHLKILMIIFRRRDRSEHRIHITFEKYPIANPMSHITILAHYTQDPRLWWCTSKM